MTSIANSLPVEDGGCAPGEKQCRQCGACLPATPEYFSRDKKGPLGLHYWCKACTRAHGRRYKQQNPQQVNDYNQRWEAENREQRLVYKEQYRQ
jgi:hypothetical protein